MGLEYSAKKPDDLTKVNTSDMSELLWWSYILNTSPEMLLSLVHQHGVSTELVRKHLQRSQAR